MIEKPEDLDDYLFQQEQLIAQRKAKLKTGPNVINVNYLPQHISPDELSGLESDIEKLGFELSAFDRSGIPYASISSLTADLMLILSKEITLTTLLVGSINSGVYDGIKGLIIKCWNFVKDKRTVSMTSKTVTEYQAKFHLVLRIGEDRSVELKTENFSAQNISAAIDQIKGTVKELDDKAHRLLVYDPVSNKWNPLEVTVDYLKQPESAIRVLPVADYLEELKKKKTN